MPNELKYDPLRVYAKSRLAMPLDEMKVGGEISLPATDRAERMRVANRIQRFTRRYGWTFSQRISEDRTHVLIRRVT